jgi:hypothetical protein
MAFVNMTRIEKCLKKDISRNCPYQIGFRCILTIDNLTAAVVISLEYLLLPGSIRRAEQVKWRGNCCIDKRDSLVQ